MWHGWDMDRIDGRGSGRWCGRLGGDGLLLLSGN